MPVANRRPSVVAASQPLQWLSADEAAFRRARRLAARDPGKEEASRRYRDFLTAFPSSAHAPTARNDLTQARAGFDEAAREALRRMIRARDAAEANGRWVDALAACERFPRHYARTEYGRAAAVEKRATLEREHGIVEEKELVRHVVGEKIASGEPATSPPPAPAPPAQKTGSYLDSLDEESSQKVLQLVESISQKGIKKSIEQVKKEEPHIVDAFHDTLVDRLYDELKARKLIQ